MAEAAVQVFIVPEFLAPPDLVADGTNALPHASELGDGFADFVGPGREGNTLPEILSGLERVVAWCGYHGCDLRMLQYYNNRRRRFPRQEIRSTSWIGVEHIVLSVLSPVSGGTSPASTTGIIIKKRDTPLLTGDR